MTDDGEICLPDRARLEGGARVFHFISLGPAASRSPVLTQALHDARARGYRQWVQPLDGLSMPSDGLPFATGIFHVSRCGSTLVSNILGRVRAVQMAAEPRAFVNMLGPLWQLFPAELRQADMRLALAFLRQPLTPEKRTFMVKFTHADLICLPDIERLAPGLRKILVFRDPLEVLTSNLRAPPAWAGFHGHPIKGGLMIGMRPAAAAALPLPEFIARGLAKGFVAAADAISRAPADWLLLDYTDLPDAVFNTVFPWLSLAPDADELPGLLEEARLYSKGPGERPHFVPDSARKRAEASPAEIDLCERWLREPYERLRGLWAWGETGLTAGADPQTTPPATVERR